MKVLVTGGAGYIGSHTAVELLNAGYEVVIVDDLSNAKVEVIDRIKEITGKSVAFYWMDCADKEKLWEVFRENNIDAVIHFAGFKAVGESVKKPLQYYRNNLDSTLSLVETMEEFGCRKLVFSSSATVYGPNNPHPYKEEMPAIQSTSPYGWTKVMIERILTDYCTAHPGFCAVLLRYFNPIGAHESGLLGDDPNGIPNNLMPYIGRVAAGQLEKLTIFGGDYETPDGTCQRDYLHVVDLAIGHLKALEYAETHDGVEAINLGTGNGISVLELVTAFEKANDMKLPYVIGPAVTEICLHSGQMQLRPRNSWAGKQPIPLRICAKAAGSLPKRTKCKNSIFHKEALCQSMYQFIGKQQRRSFCGRRQLFSANAVN